MVKVSVNSAHIFALQSLDKRAETGACLRYNALRNLWWKTSDADRIVKVDVGAYWSLIQRLNRSEVVLHSDLRVVDVTLHQFPQQWQLLTKKAIAFINSYSHGFLGILLMLCVVQSVINKKFVFEVYTLRFNACTSVAVKYDAYRFDISSAATERRHWLKSSHVTWNTNCFPRRSLLPRNFRQQFDITLRYCPIWISTTSSC